MPCSALNCSMSCYGLLTERLKKQRVGLRIKHSARMRVECDRGRNGINRTCTFRNRPHYLLMAQMETVKNA